MARAGSSAPAAGSPAQPVPLAQRLLAGDQRALARAISLVEDGAPEGAEVLRAVYPQTGTADVVGITGPPGVGKSTLIAGLVGRRRGAARTVGVLSVDPTSPFTHGAVLGDRIRLAEHFLDAGVYIRSMASRGALGGLAAATAQAVLLLDAAGLQEIVVETVGVGQAEVDVLGVADTVALVLMPGSGDSVQALKAGVMEIPDIIVVNKSDHPLTDITVRELRSAMALARALAADEARWSVPVLATRATTGEGLDELIARLDQHRDFLRDSGALERRRAGRLADEVLTLAGAELVRELRDRVRTDRALQDLLDEVLQRRLDPASAARALLAATTAAAPAGAPFGAGARNAAGSIP